MSAAWRASSFRDGESGFERDVLPHRVPHRAVFLVREVDGSLNLIPGNRTSDVELERERGEAVRVFLRAFPGKGDLETAQIVAAFAKDVDHVHPHAAGEREGERLD